MERGENRSSDKDCGGFSERTCRDVLTKKIYRTPCEWYSLKPSCLASPAPLVKNEYRTLYEQDSL